MYEVCPKDPWTFLDICRMKTVVTPEKFFELIEDRYNRCFVCGEKIVIDDVIISVCRNAVGGASPAGPGNFVIKRSEIHSNINNEEYIAYDQLNVHEECFFDCAGDGWKF